MMRITRACCTNEFSRETLWTRQTLTKAPNVKRERESPNRLKRALSVAEEDCSIINQFFSLPVIMYQFRNLNGLQTFGSKELNYNCRNLQIFKFAARALFILGVAMDSSQNPARPFYKLFDSGKLFNLKTQLIRGFLSCGSN